MTSRETGPLTRLFPCSESKILDHMVVMRPFDYSILEISRISRIDAKKTLRIILELEK
jgi:hypothetical protein